MKYTTVKNSLINRKVKVVSNQSGSTYPIGSIQYVEKLYINDKVMLKPTLKGKGPGYWILLSDLEFIAVNKEEIEAEMKDLVERMEELTAKLEWLEESGNEDYDEDVFKAYEVLKRLGIKDMQAAKDIISILNK